MGNEKMVGHKISNNDDGQNLDEIMNAVRNLNQQYVRLADTLKKANELLKNRDGEISKLRSGLINLKMTATTEQSRMIDHALGLQVRQETKLKLDEGANMTNLGLEIVENPKYAGQNDLSGIDGLVL